MAFSCTQLDTHLNDSQGGARNVTLRVGKVPVFYTPYLQFPLEMSACPEFCAVIRHGGERI